MKKQEEKNSRRRYWSFIPMAIIYLLILLYFKSIGGYKPVHIAGTTAAETSPPGARTEPA